MKKFFAIIIIAIAAFATNASAQVSDLPKGIYKLDPAHASLIFRVNHMGFSNYTARFKRFDAELEIDPGNPGAAKVTAIIDATSLETDYPNPEKVDFNRELQNKSWLDTAQFAQIQFTSTKIELRGGNKAYIHGNLNLHGISKPIVLSAKFNGGYRGIDRDPNARIGFSATGTILRSDFGITTGLPAPGTKMGVGDEIEVIIEAEFTGPSWQGN